MQYLEKFYLWVIQAGMPIVYAYVLFCNNVFLNTASENAQGLEKLGNQLLSPVHYIFAGKIADANDYQLKQRFTYEDGFAWKTISSTVVLPVSLVLGSAVKGISYLSSETRENHRKIIENMHSTKTFSNEEYYEKAGVHLIPFKEAEFFSSIQHQRRPGDENNLRAEKEALKEVVRIFEENKIPFWVDCGTLLGTYRYGGAIPWDNDIDIAVLSPDFRNIMHALNSLDKEKYMVIDWSSRSRPETFVVICIKETGSRIDIGHFNLYPEKKEVRLVLSNEENIFLPEIWKKTERRFVVDTPYEMIFPLKKANFDGIEVPVPNQIEEYLKARYGQDLRPAKIYDPITLQYEKDLTHPYWQNF